MATFHFDFCQGSEIQLDTQGLSLPSAEKAYLEAYAGARDMWSELLGRRQDPRRCSFRVRDEDGNVMFVLPFAELLESCRDNGGPRPFLNDKYHRAAETAARARRASAEFQHQLTKARAALKEAAGLIAQVV